MCVNKCTLGVKKELGNEKASMHTCRLHWEHYESICQCTILGDTGEYNIVHGFSGRRLKLPSCMFIVHVYKGLLLLP